MLPGLQTIINALLMSAVQLLEVMALNCFCLMIFAIFALVMYMGKLRQKCVIVPFGPADQGTQTWDYQIDQQKMWYNWVHNPNHWAPRDPSYPKYEVQPCGNNSFTRLCADGYVCLQVGDNFDDNWTGKWSFDDIFMSLLTTFQLLTTDFWERPYELVLSSSGPTSIVFFLIVLFFGSFYLLNLMLAVVAMSYEMESVRRREGGVTKKQKLHINRASSIFSFDEPHKLNLQLINVFRRRILKGEGMRAFQASYACRSFISIAPNENRKTLSAAIWGLMGRNFSDGEGKGAVELEKNIAIEIDPKSKSVFKKMEVKSELVGQIYIKEDQDQSDNFANLSNRRKCMNTDSRITLAALVLRRKLRPIVDHHVFDTCMTFFIVSNTFFFALEHHGESENIKLVLEGANSFFAVIFYVECFLKLLALQKDYFAAGWNSFDFVLVLTSSLDFLVPSDTTYLRSLRLLRIFKLAQSWITMKVLLSIIFATFGALGNLVLLLGIVIYILAILGMQVIGTSYSPENFGALKNPENFPRWNFHNFWHSFLVVFRIICGEWIELSWECFTAHKRANASYKCFLIFMPTLILGNYIVLNLFLALLLDSFNTEDLEAAKFRELEASGKAHNIKKIVVLLMLKNKGEGGTKDGKKTSSTNIDGSTVSAIKSVVSVESLARVRFKGAAKRVIIKNRVAATERRIEESMTRSAKKIEAKLASFGLKSQDNSPSRSVEAQLLGSCFPKKCLDIKCAMCIKIKKLKCRKWDKFRRGTAKIVGHSAFEFSILAMIFLSSITLCFEDVNLESRPIIKDILFYLNCIFCIIFIIEMVLKWFAFGLWGYFSNTWCILDFFIVVVSLITLHFDIQLRFYAESSHKGQGYRSNLAALKALRTLRALRPLRAISRWEGMKIVVNALIYAIPLIFNVFLVCLLFWLIFSIMGVQLFKGKFWKCVDSDGERIDYLIVPTKRVCCAAALAKKYSWINTFPSFDNVLDGYLSLFQIATYEGWMELMAAGIDSVDVDFQPRRENGPEYYIFFLIFIVFGAFFTLNLFIGVLVDNFGMLKKKYEGNLIEIFLTPSQRNYIQALKKVSQMKPQKLIKRPINKFLCVFYDLSMSRRFEIAVFSMIFLNLLVISFETFDQSYILVDITNATNSFFTTIYILECVVKILGLRQFYFTSLWNILDFVLVVASLTDLVMNNEHIDFPIPPTMLRVVRVVRIGKILRLVKSARGIRKLLNALVVSLPALGNIGALIGLTTFIYAILGMASFSGAPKYEAVDQVINWDTFLNSCVVLLRLLLAAGWNDVLDSLTQAPMECGSYRKMACGLEGEPDCPSKAIAIAYFVSYILIVFLIIINMYTAIILENYEEACNESEGGITEDDLEMFYIHWARYDPQATQFIRFENLSDFLAVLDPPFRYPKPNILPIVVFNLPINRGNQIHCLDILYALVKRVVGDIDDDNGEFKKLQEKLEPKFYKQFPVRKLLDVISTTRIWKRQLNAAIVIQRAWRAYYKRTYPDGRPIQKESIKNTVAPKNKSK